MGHPAYQQAYEFTTGLIAMAFSIQWYWMPFLMMSVIVGLLKWLDRQARRSETVDDYERHFHEEFRGTLDRAGSRWRSWRR